MHWYFAYGANLSRAIFESRRGMKPAAVRRARLEDFRLAFSEPGIPIFEPSFANVEPASGRSVHGVAYALDQAEMEALIADESSNYQRIEVFVHEEDDNVLPCVTFQSRRTVPDRAPSFRYRQLLIDGAREHGLPESYIDFLQELPCIDRGPGRTLNGVFYASYVRLRRLGIRHENHLDALEHVEAFLERCRRLLGRAP